MPVHVVRIPPGILQALPKQPRLADATNFVATRDDTFFAILANQFAQRVNDFRIYIFKPLVVGPKIRRSCGFAVGSRIEHIIEIVAVGSVGILRATLRSVGADEPRWRGRQRYRRRRVVSIRRHNLAGHARPALSCGVRFHSTSFCSVNRMSCIRISIYDTVCDAQLCFGECSQWGYWTQLRTVEGCSQPREFESPTPRLLLPRIID